MTSPLTIFASLFNKTNRFHVVALYSYKSQMTSKRVKNVSDTLNCALLVLGIHLVKHSTIVNSAKNTNQKPNVL